MTQLEKRTNWTRHVIWTVTAKPGMILWFLFSKLFAELKIEWHFHNNAYSKSYPILTFLFTFITKRWWSHLLTMGTNHTYLPWNTRFSSYEWKVISCVRRANNTIYNNRISASSLQRQMDDSQLLLFFFFSSNVHVCAQVFVCFFRLPVSFRA